MVAYTITGELPVKVKEMQVYLPRIVFFSSPNTDRSCFHGMPSARHAYIMISVQINCVYETRYAANNPRRKCVCVEARCSDHIEMAVNSTRCNKCRLFCFDLARAHRSPQCELHSFCPTIVPTIQQCGVAKNGVECVLRAAACCGLKFNWAGRSQIWKIWRSHIITKVKSTENCVQIQRCPNCPMHFARCTFIICLFCSPSGPC